MQKLLRVHLGYARFDARICELYKYMMNYQKHYNLLMERSPKQKPVVGYFERHRIRPGCIGGRYVKGNIVYLTPEEHYVAHQLLVKIYPDNKKMLNAAILMTTSKFDQRSSNRVYGWLRRKQSKNMIENNPMKNPEIASKVSTSNKGRVAHNKITKTYDWNCLSCNKLHTSLDTAHTRNKKFCDRSCQAKYTNKNRSGKYKHKIGLKRKFSPRPNRRKISGVCEL